MLDPETYDVAIVGAGPAGMSAAIELMEAQLSVVVLDEQTRLGGQILRQPPKSVKIERWLPGSEYVELKRTLEAAERSERIDWMCGAVVWAVIPPRKQKHNQSPFCLKVYRNGQSCQIQSRYVVIAAGCYEMPVPMPGWTLPGVMGAGAIQTLLKSQRVVSGERIVLSGTHPLQLVVAEQLIDAGANVVAILFGQSWRSVFHVLRHLDVALKNWRQFANILRILFKLLCSRVRISFSSVASAAEGQDRLCRVQIRRVLRNGNLHETPTYIDCDNLGLSYGFLPSSELARQAGAKASWLSEGGWAIECGESLESSIKGLYVAGEQTGIKGAKGSLLEGKLAGLSILQQIGLSVGSDIQSKVRTLTRELLHVKKFASLLSITSEAPAHLLANLMDDGTIVCRCEEVTVAGLDLPSREYEFMDSASSVKLRTRVGMGLCQGRLCEISVRRYLTQIKNVPEAGIGSYSVQIPVKPVPIAAILSEKSGDGGLQRR